MEKLGFLEENSWETEEAERKFLFESITKMKQEAWESALNNERQKRQNYNPNNDKKASDLPT